MRIYDVVPPRRRGGEPESRDQPVVQGKQGRPEATPDESPRHARGSGAMPLADGIMNLFRYYAECARRDEAQRVSPTTADEGKRFIPWPFRAHLADVAAADAIPVSPAFRRELANGGGTLLYGYPTYLDGSRVMPLFTWPLDYELDDAGLWPGAAVDSPQMNPKYLQKLVPKDSEDAEWEILDSLNLARPTDEPPDMAQIAAWAGKFRLPRNQDTRESIDPQALSGFPTPSNRPYGLVNCAALFAMEQPQYTAGLIRELDRLASSGAPGWESTALATMLGEGQQTEGPAGAQPAVEIVTLNEEQREVVGKALSSPLTAVTGPPGTGKSQIVVSLIADAYVRGQPVLFASKNHKAIEVVEARLHELAGTQLIVKAGRSFRSELADQLTAMLALQSAPDDQAKYESLRERHRALHSEERRLWGELEEARAAYDRLLRLEEDLGRVRSGYPAAEWGGFERERGRPNQLEVALERTELRLRSARSSRSSKSLDHFPQLDTASDRVTKALDLVDQHSASTHLSRDHLLHLPSASRQLEQAFRLTEEHTAGADLPFSQSLPLRERLTPVLSLAHWQVSDGANLFGRLSRWLGRGRDRKQILREADRAVAACPALPERPPDGRSFDGLHRWLVQARETLQQMHEAGKRVLECMDEAVAACPALPARPALRSLNECGEWLRTARSQGAQLQAVERDLRRVQSMMAEAVAACPALGSCPAGELPLAEYGTWLARSQSTLSELRAVDEDRKEIQRAVATAAEQCPMLGTLPPADQYQSLPVLRAWLTRALEKTEALQAIDAYRSALAALRQMRSRDELARQLRQRRTQLTASGKEVVELRARLLPDRLHPEDRIALANFKALQQQLADDKPVNFGQIMHTMEGLFPVVSRHFPAWRVTSLSASHLPLAPNLFELLIVDEASQCDIASALPLLYRSKRAVVIGDSFQLRHISKLEPYRDQKLMADHGLADQPHFSYGANSLFDLSTSVADELTQLRDHYRSHFDIVRFSNKEWYRDTLRICTNYRRLELPDGERGVRWTDVSGTTTRPKEGSAFIRSEVNEVVSCVSQLLNGPGFRGSVGVVTPFRAQANEIYRNVAQMVSQDTLGKAQFIVDTAHKFQGDERDVVFFAPCIASDLAPGLRRWLTNTGNLFNVAITRARSLLHVVGSHSACAASGIAHVENFASYCTAIAQMQASPYATTLAADEGIGPGEPPLCAALRARGLKPLPQYRVDQYQLDLAVIEGDTWIDVEADGEATHRGSRADAERDIRMIELGWRVVRFWNHQIRDDLDYCVRTVLDLIRKAS